MTKSILFVLWQENKLRFSMKQKESEARSEVESENHYIFSIAIAWFTIPHTDRWKECDNSNSTVLASDQVCVCFARVCVWCVRINVNIGMCTSLCLCVYAWVRKWFWQLNNTLILLTHKWSEWQSNIQKSNMEECWFVYTVHGYVYLLSFYAKLDDNKRVPLHLTILSFKWVNGKFLRNYWLNRIMVELILISLFFHCFVNWNSKTTHSQARTYTYAKNSLWIECVLVAERTFRID